MTIASVITTGFTVIFAALTPAQRWQAARQPDSSFMSERGFILVGLVTIIILTILLIVVSYHRRTKERKISNRRFFEYADRFGLTNRERQILQDIATRAELKRIVSIFSMIQAFDRGTARLIEDTLALQGVDSSKRLSAEMSALREKLGFEKQSTASVGSAKPSSRPTSRQISPGKKLYVTCPNADDLTNIESIVIKNSDVQLTSRLATPLQRSPGEVCCVRYCFGGSVWEYDATVVRCEGDILVLTHSNDVRFINRRRFLRVPVSKPALIAHFAKYRSLMPSLALIFHLFDLVARNEQPNERTAVSFDATQTAAAWCELLAAHARRIYSIATRPETAKAKTVLQKIKTGKLKP